MFSKSRSIIAIVWGLRSSAIFSFKGWNQQQTLELKLVNLRPPRILSDKKVLFDFLHRFPHDTQHCYISLESWTFTDEDMRFSKIILFSGPWKSRPKPKFQAQLGISCERSFWDEPFQDGQLSLWSGISRVTTNIFNAHGTTKCTYYLHLYFLFIGHWCWVDRSINTL